MLSVRYCLLYSDRYGKTAVDLAWHPVMKEALQTTAVDSVLNKVLSCLLYSQPYGLRYSVLFLLIFKSRVEQAFKVTWQMGHKW